MKTSELSGAALDWAVAKCEGFGDSPRFMEIFMYQQSRGMGYCYSTDWSRGGPIIERERIAVEFLQWDDIDCTMPIWTSYKFGTDFGGQGSTPLISAMRCFVASRMGDDIELPEEIGG
jgi:hypothetical protein